MASIISVSLCCAVPGIHETSPLSQTWGRFFYAPTAGVLREHRTCLPSADVWYARRFECIQASRSSGRVTLSRCFLPFKKRIGIENRQRLKSPAVDESGLFATDISVDETNVPAVSAVGLPRQRAGGRSGLYDCALVQQAIGVEKQLGISDARKRQTSRIALK